MKDQEIIDTIRRLVDDEHQARERRNAGTLSSPEEHQQLNQLEQTLDQCWDLLRQRRAKEAIGEDPASASVRPASEVEGYQQ